jgi:hypothetical protein
LAGKFSRFYVAVDRGPDAVTIFRALHGRVFAAENGREYRAAVDFAPNQMVPWGYCPDEHPPAVPDRVAGTLEEDEEFLQFKQQLEADPEEPPSAEALLVQLNAASQSSVKKSALVDFLEKRTLHIKARPKRWKQRTKAEAEEEEGRSRKQKAKAEAEEEEGRSRKQKAKAKAKKKEKREEGGQKQEAREQTKNGQADRGGIPSKAALKEKEREAQAHSGALAQSGPGPSTRPPSGQVAYRSIVATPCVAGKGKGGAERQPAAGPAAVRGGGEERREKPKKPKKPKGRLIPTAILARKVS